MAYYFKSTPFVDCDGNALAGTGEKYYKESQIYADVTDKEDRALSGSNLVKSSKL